MDKTCVTENRRRLCEVGENYGKVLLHEHLEIVQ